MTMVTRCLCVICLAMIGLKVVSGCPDQWLTFQGNCYSFVETKLNWFRATHACKEMNAVLVDITSKAEEDFLRGTAQHLQAQGVADGVIYWTSGNDLAVEGQWVWGYPSEVPMAYTNWDHGEPNNAGPNGVTENCALLWGQGAWNDRECKSHEHFICKQKDSSVVVG